MKNYETGICGVCRQPKNDHYKKCSEHEQPGGCKLPNVHCQWPLCVSPLGHDFKDSGTAHLCSEPVASKLLEALEFIANAITNKDYQYTCRKVAQEAINEALKRE